MPSRALIAILACLAAPTLASQPPAIPQATRDVHAAFLRAFNDGSITALRSFVRAYSSGRDEAASERAVAYWRGIRREVGPLELIGPTREARPNRVADIFWYRGRTTGAYPGIEFVLDTGAAPRIRSYGVNRAFRPSIAARPPVVPERELPRALERYFVAVADSGHFSGAVSVTRNGREVYHGAFGHADLATGRRNTLDTPFRLASVTKIFTGVAILQLADQGRLALDDPVARFIPEYPAPVARQVTVRHLLTHQSGIELDGDSIYLARVGAAQSVRELIALHVERLPAVLGQGLESFRPLGHYDYTNEGIDLLAAIVERVSGQSWSAYLSEHVFQSAGMENAGADFLRPVPGIPIGYSERVEGGGGESGRVAVPALRGPIADVRPAGSGYATVRDLAAFMRAITDGTLLRPETARQMMSVQVEFPAPPGSGLACTRAYGFTIVITRCRDGATSVGHSGGTFGQSTVVDHFPESGYTVVVLSNYDRVTWWVEQRVLEMLGLR